MHAWVNIICRWTQEIIITCSQLGRFSPIRMTIICLFFYIFSGKYSVPVVNCCQYSQSEEESHCRKSYNFQPRKVSYNTIIRWDTYINLNYTFLFRAAVKSAFLLLPLLGLTWVFGLLAVNNNTSVFAWLFTIFNSLQVSFSNITIRHWLIIESLQLCFAGKLHFYLSCS